MPKYLVPVIYKMSGTFEVTAESMETAIEHIQLNGLYPKDAEYVPESWEVLEDEIEEINE